MKKKLIVFIKFIIFTAIFYLLLVCNIFHIGEKLLPEKSSDYLENSIPADNKNIEETFFSEDMTTTQTGHFAAETNYDIMTQNACKKVPVCTKIQFNGEYSPYEKFIYTKAITALVGFIDSNGSQKKAIKDVIQDIEINKDTGKRRGYATWDTIILNLGSVSSNKEFAELVTHEMGHITDLGYIQGSSTKKDKNYTEFGKSVFAINDASLIYYKLSRQSETIRKSEAQKKDFCSGYGMSDPFEDFAECFNLYTNHNILFREIAKSNITLKKKYNFIAAILSGGYMSSNSQELALIKTDKTRRPRDTTKIAN